MKDELKGASNYVNEFRYCLESVVLRNREIGKLKF